MPGVWCHVSEGLEAAVGNPSDFYALLPSGSSDESPVAKPMWKSMRLRQINVFRHQEVKAIEPSRD